MAKAATLTIVEAENIVPVGSIDPNDVDLPGIFVDRIVPATDKKNIEIKKLRENEDGSVTESKKDAAQIQRERIGRRAAKELKQGYYVNLGVGKCSHSIFIFGSVLMDCRYSHPGTVLLAQRCQSLGSIGERNSWNGMLFDDSSHYQILIPSRDPTPPRMKLTLISSTPVKRP